MRVRYYFTFFVCAWVAFPPEKIQAEENKSGHTDQGSRNTSQRERHLQRQLQFHKRLGALLHVSGFMRRTAPYRSFTLGEIKQQYKAKGAALAKVAKSSMLREQAAIQAKARALAEVKAIAFVMRARLEAEQRAIATALHQMNVENPNYGEDAYDWRQKQLRIMMGN